MSGLENRRFRDLAKSLRRYRDTLVLSLLPKPDEFYNQTAGGAATGSGCLSQRTVVENRTSPERADSASSTASARRRSLVDAVRGELAHPNAFIDISTALIAAGTEPVDRNDPVTDCILGVNIHSDAHTKGSVNVASIPSDNKAVLEFRSKGSTYSKNVGHKSPAVIHSTADTDYTAVKRVELTDRAFVGLASRANATTDTHIHSVAKEGGGLGSRLVSRIGWNKAMQSEHQAEAIAADHAEDRIENRFNDEVGEKLGKVRERYENEYRRPLERRGEVPEHIRFSSTKDGVGD